MHAACVAPSCAAGKDILGFTIYNKHGRVSEGRGRLGEGMRGGKQQTVRTAARRAAAPHLHCNPSRAAPRLALSSWKC